MSEQLNFQTVLDQATLQLDETLDVSTAKLLKRTGLTLSVAESVTGGLISQRLSKFQDASQYFYGGIVCLNPLMAIRLCGVSPSTIRDKGDVSSDVAVEMAIGVSKLSQSDIGLAVIGGYDSRSSEQETELVGRVMIGFSYQSVTASKVFTVRGLRTVILAKAAQSAIMVLKQMVIKHVRSSVKEG